MSTKIVVLARGGRYGGGMMIFTAPLWRWQAGTWHFITLPGDHAAEVRFESMGQRGGFGSVRVEARIGDTVWRTSLFPDKARDSYLLPVKKAVREAEGLAEDQMVSVSLELVG